MDNAIIIALIAAVPTIFSVLATASVTRHRINVLEDKMNEHNAFMKRFVVIESKVSGMAEFIDKHDCDHEELMDRLTRIEERAKSNTHRLDKQAT
ncbi:MAG TPA: hypothetical protein DEB31_11165 [Clostridiales bacterium]|nr:hypothetical protein [Clostridiales bacterium]